jgi:hypothetical protein
MQPRTFLILAILLPLVAFATKQYNAATSFTDANAGGFVDPAPIISSATGDEDEETDFVYAYGWVPYRHDMRPLFCLRKGVARTVTCFYVGNESHGGVLVEHVIPKGG